MSLTKIVDGVEVQMSAEEEASIRAEWARAAQMEPAPGPTESETSAARAALDALVTAGIITAEARATMTPPPLV